MGQQAEIGDVVVPEVGAADRVWIIILLPFVRVPLEIVWKGNFWFLGGTFFYQFLLII